MEKTKSLITQDYLRQILNYDSKTGVFTWKVVLSPVVKIGSVAGTAHHSGYIYIGIGGRQYSGHRLAWLYVYGVWPKRLLDHKNECKSDNWISNLREATFSQNLHNQSKLRATNTSGCTGVRWVPIGKKWAARITVNSKVYNLGHFDTFDLARSAYLTEKSKILSTLS